MTRQYEQEVFDEFKKYANVSEAWSLYDTIGISKTLYGGEQNAGWFNTFNAFGQQQTHSFFKQRTEGMLGTPYTNQQSSDSMDFAFVAHSVGLALFAPVPNISAVASSPDGTAGQLSRVDASIGHWFAADLPRHMGFQFKIQQDIRIELPALQAPPGYGVAGGGVAFPQLAAAPAFGSQVTCSTNVQQGVPVLSNRYPLPFRIGIPRTASIEGIIHLSEYAQQVLQTVIGPQDMVFNSNDGTAPYKFFQKRYLIQVSLIGERLVQQRGQYHR